MTGSCSEESTALVQKDSVDAERGVHADAEGKETDEETAVKKEAEEEAMQRKVEAAAAKRKEEEEAMAAAAAAENAAAQAKVRILANVKKYLYV